mmetsp:Transcript_38147/g.36514  ORF Transcript_38147/g.36514 Transcript_38147/m.36514 type:complete len:99 (+) Transcript_38147:1273-1569(+)
MWNGLAYAAMRYFKKEKSKKKEQMYHVAFQKYQKKIAKINTYLFENQIFYNSIYNQEQRNNGLIIMEAYVGLADHIYSIESGIQIYKVPDNHTQYLDC